MEYSNLKTLQDDLVEAQYSISHGPKTIFFTVSGLTIVMMQAWVRNKIKLPDGVPEFGQNVAHTFFFSSTLMTCKSLNLEFVIKFK